MTDSSAGSRGLVGVRAGSQGFPANAETLDVTISEIRAIPAVGEPVPLALGTPQVIDIKSLSTGPEFNLDADLPAGDYVKLELIVPSGNAVMTFNDGTPPVDVTVPSGPQTGLKLPIHFTIDPGTRAVLVLDWNTGNSLHCTGNGEWKLRPTAMTVTDIRLETIDNVSVAGTSLVDPLNPDVPPGTPEVPMLQLDFTVDVDSATVESLDVALIGTGSAADVERVDIWVDGGDGAFGGSAGTSDDDQIGGGDMLASPMSLPITPQAVNALGTLKLFVSFDIAAVAETVPPTTVGVSVTSATVAWPDVIDPLQFPINSGTVNIATPAPPPP